MTKRSIFFVLMATVLLIAGCSNEEKIEWQTKDFGPMTFEYPKDWVMSDNPFEMAYVTISREPYKPAKPLNDSVIMIYGWKPQMGDVREFIERFYVGEEGKIVSESEELVGGYQAKKLVTEQVEEGEEGEEGTNMIHTIAYEVDTQSPLTMVFSIEYKDEYKTDVEIFDHLLESVKFDPKKSKETM